MFLHLFLYLFVKLFFFLLSYLFLYFLFVFFCPCSCIFWYLSLFLFCVCHLSFCSCVQWSMQSARQRAGSKKLPQSQHPSCTQTPLKLFVLLADDGDRDDHAGGDNDVGNHDGDDGAVDYGDMMIFSSPNEHTSRHSDTDVFYYDDDVAYDDNDQEEEDCNQS